MTRWSPSSVCSVRRRVSVLGPAVADRDRPPDLLGHERVVGHDHDRRPQLGVHPPEQAEHLLRRPAVELARGLVREHHVRVVGERDGDRDPLLLAAAQAVGPVLRAVRQADDVQQLQRPLLAALPAVEDHRQLHVLHRGQVRQQVAPGLLPHEPDDPAPEPRPLRAGDAARGRSPATVARPADGTSMPPRMASSVDLPLPEAPTIAIISPAVDEQVEALEGDHLEVGELEDPDEPVARDDGAVAVPGPRRGAGASRRPADRALGALTRRPGRSSTTGAGPGRLRRVGVIRTSLGGRRSGRPGAGARRRARARSPTTTIMAARIARSSAGSRTTGTSIGAPTSEPDAHGRPEQREQRGAEQPAGEERGDGDRAVLGEQERRRLAARQPERPEMGGLLGAGEAGERERGRDAERRVGGRHERRDEDERPDRLGHRRRAAGRGVLGLARDGDRRATSPHVRRAAPRRPTPAPGRAAGSGRAAPRAPGRGTARGRRRRTPRPRGRPGERVDDRVDAVLELVALDRMPERPRRP